MTDRAVEITRDGAIAWLRLDAYNDGHDDGWDEAFDAIEVNLKGHIETWKNTVVQPEVVIQQILKDILHLRALKGYSND